MSFDKEGNFITQYGERGRSSSEYVRVNSFDVDKHYVYLYDDASEKMISFTHGGEFVQKVETPFWGEDFKVLDDGSFLFSLKPGKSNVKLCMTDSLFNIKKYFLTLTRKTKTIIPVTPFFKRLVIVFIIQMTCLIQPCVTPKGELVHSYLFNFGKYAPPLELVMMPVN